MQIMLVFNKIIHYNTNELNFGVIKMKRANNEPYTILQDSKIIKRCRSYLFKDDEIASSIYVKITNQNSLNYQEHAEFIVGVIVSSPVFDRNILPMATNNLGYAKTLIPIVYQICIIEESKLLKKVQNIKEIIECMAIFYQDKHKQDITKLAPTPGILPYHILRDGKVNTPKCSTKYRFKDDTIVDEIYTAIARKYNLSNTAYMQLIIEQIASNTVFDRNILPMGILNKDFTEELMPLLYQEYKNGNETLTKNPNIEEIMECMVITYESYFKKSITELESKAKTTSSTKTTENRPKETNTVPTQNISTNSRQNTNNSSTNTSYKSTTEARSAHTNTQPHYLQTHHILSIADITIRHFDRAAQGFCTSILCHGGLIQAWYIPNSLCNTISREFTRARDNHQQLPLFVAMDHLNLRFQHYYNSSILYEVTNFRCIRMLNTEEIYINVEFRDGNKEIFSIQQAVYTKLTNLMNTALVLYS